MKKFDNNSLVWAVRVGAFNFDVRMASEEVKTLMKLNARSVDVAALKLLKAQRPEGITAEDVKSILQPGKALREPFPAPDADPDAPEGGIPCSTCGISFVPVFYRNKEDEPRGSVTEFKAEKFAVFSKAAKDETLDESDREAAIRFLKASDELMKILVTGRQLPNVRLFATCPNDVQAERKGREKVIITYLPIREALEQATVHNARVQGGKSRAFMNARLSELSGSGSSGRRSGGGFRSQSGGGHFGGNRRKDDRPRTEFHGASFLEVTADALAKAEAEGKLPGGLDQLASASDEFLASIGAASGDRAANAVRTIASRSLEREKSANAVSTAATDSGLKLSEVKGAQALETFRQRKPEKSRRKGPRRAGRNQRNEEESE